MHRILSCPYYQPIKNLNKISKFTYSLETIDITFFLEKSGHKYKSFSKHQLCNTQIKTNVS